MYIRSRGGGITGGARRGVREEWKVKEKRIYEEIEGEENGREGVIKEGVREGEREEGAIKEKGR